VDRTVVDGGGGDQEGAAGVDSVAEALVHRAVGPGGQRRFDGAGEQPGVVHRVVVVHEHDAVVFLCE
jgi:hypothetical protein